MQTTRLSADLGHLELDVRTVLLPDPPPRLQGQAQMGLPNVLSDPCLPSCPGLGSCPRSAPVTALHAGGRDGGTGAGALGLAFLEGL